MVELVDTDGDLDSLAILEGTLEVAQAIYDLLPECGGFVTGDACSGARLVATGIAAAALAAARVVSLPSVVV